jgi:hypothetical protein
MDHPQPRLPAVTLDTVFSHNAFGIMRAIVCRIDGGAPLLQFIHYPLIHLLDQIRRTVPPRHSGLISDHNHFDPEQIQTCNVVSSMGK